MEIRIIMLRKTIWALLILAVIFGGCSLFNRSGLNERKLANFRAFTKLYGYIRFFHPSDEASKIDWDRFAVYGMKKVESAGSDKELKDILEEMFKPIAPALALHNSANFVYEKSLIIPADTDNLKLVAWQHRGVGLADKLGPYVSLRTNRVAVSNTNFGTIVQNGDAKQLAGRKIRFRGAVKTIVSGAGNQAQLWFRADLKDNKTGFTDNMSDRPITSADWKEYEITGTIDTDAVSISFGCLLTGQGKAWVDDLHLYYQENSGAWKEIEIPNSDFETGQDGTPPVPWGVNQGDYTVTLTSSEKYKGNMSALIEYTGPERLAGKLFDRIPAPGETLTKKLSDDLYCTFPLTLYSTVSGAVGTIPKGDVALFNALRAGMDKEVPSPIDANNVYVRLADIAIAWNVWENFYTYFDAVGVNWEPKLNEYLEKAFDAKDGEEFFQILKEFTAEIKDGQGAVSWDSEKKYSYPPVILDRVENRITVVRLLEDSVMGIRPGDVITKIDGEDVDSLINNISKYVSSATPQWKMYKVTHYELTKGDNGTDIRLTVKDQSGKTRDVVLKRSIESNQMRSLGWDDEKRPDEIAELENGIVYVDLCRSPMDSINKSIDKIADAKGVIFDVRGYPNSNDEILRHMIDSPVLSAKWNVPRTIYPDRENLVGYDTLGRWRLTPLQPRIKGKIVFLTNARAISYAESILGIVEAYKLGEIVGEPTAGTNGDVNTLSLPGGFLIYWTGMKVLKNDGSQHHGIGIKPTVPVHRTIKGVSEGRDEFMEKAIELVNSK